MPVLYRVIGTLAVPGNKTHPNVGQSINYCFDLDYADAASNFGFPTIVGTPNVFSFGPLGVFEVKNVSTQGYVGFFSPVAEIDLLFKSLMSPPPPAISGMSWLFNCTDVSTGVCAPFYIGSGLNIYGTACAAIYEVNATERQPPSTGVRNISSR
jgi:hypothetical protein